MSFLSMKYPPKKNDGTCWLLHLQQQVFFGHRIQVKHTASIRMVLPSLRVDPSIIEELSIQWYRKYSDFWMSLTSAARASHTNLHHRTHGAPDGHLAIEVLAEVLASLRFFSRGVSRCATRFLSGAAPGSQGPGPHKPYKVGGAPER